MYKKIKAERTQIRTTPAGICETIEEKLRRVMADKTPITDRAEVIYTDRKEGVVPQFDIRTDKMEVMVEAMDMATKNMRDKRQGKYKLGEEAKKGMEAEKKSETKNSGGPGTATGDPKTGDSTK